MTLPRGRLSTFRDCSDSMKTDLRSAGVLVVDLDALARNYRRMQAAASAAECAAVVKANAYGLGMARVANRLRQEGCRRFFVATATEGRELRQVLPDAAIYVFEGVAEGEQATLLDAELTPVLNSLQQIECWSRAGGARAILHIDTGMSRLGLSEREVVELERAPRRLAGLSIEYVMTHYACADTPEHRLNREQLSRFDDLRKKLPAARTSIGNSAGIFLGASYCGDLARAGIGLYGGNPFSERPSPVEQVVQLQAKIVQLRDVEEECTVGYGATHDTHASSRLAICGVGYADGYPRSVGNRVSASFKGIRVPVVGRVSMDLTCLDVSNVPAAEIAVGDYADLIGGAVGIDEVAAAAGTISYEILTGLGGRLERRYLG